MKKPIYLLMPLMAISFLTNCGSTPINDVCLVNFDTDGGSFIASQKIKRGETITKPDDPSKYKHYFKGWLLDNNSFDFATPIEQDITLTAKWDVYEKEYDDDCPYLTFNAEYESSVYYQIHGSNVDVDIEYSTNMSDWIDWERGDEHTITIDIGNKIYVRNTKSHLSVDSSNYVRFYMSGKIAASGQISSLTKSPTIHNYEYYDLFYDCDGLIRAPRLPAAKLADYCYYYMFSCCDDLLQTPELPATTLAEGCYYGMFYYCENLIEALELPATTIADNCYYYMFCGCTELLEVPKILPATTLAEECYEGMFYDCYKLEEAPELPATTLADSCYEDMFCDCYSLKKAPELPATTLVKDCYCDMFCDCYSLTKAPELPATKLASNCYYYMFCDCYSLTKAPELKATIMAEKCYARMFTSCYGLQEAPELKATTLAPYCYYAMFYDCYGLIEVPDILPATTLANNCCYQMFYGCHNLKEAPELPATTLANNCYQEMFKNCYSLEKLKVGFGSGSDEWPDVNNCTTGWLNNAGKNAENPVFIWNGTDGVTPRDGSHVPSNWVINPIQ